MKIEQRKVKVREIVGDNRDWFIEDVALGSVKAMENQILDIRPEYQREFVYKESQQQAVINTILNGFPLNSMYFVDRQDGTYEVLDGQQRILSICLFCSNELACLIPSKTNVGHFDTCNFMNLSKQNKERVLDYELDVYFCSGTEDEKLDWFTTINIAGAELTNQEILNAVYHGQWLTDAKRLISKANSPCQRKYGKYLGQGQDRQLWLEKIFKWKANDEGIDSVKDYMQKHVGDTNATEVWSYVEHVFEWVEETFGKFIKEMKGIQWGILYNEHKDDTLDPKVIQAQLAKLLKDPEIRRKQGIFEYLLTDEEKNLNLRVFDEGDKRTAYENQGHKCKHCGKVFEFDEMCGDHIKPWSKGGRTTPDNLQMLCKKCNEKKNNHYTG